MKRAAAAPVEGRFQHVIYSPRGEVEGALLQAGRETMQLVIEHGDDAAAAVFHGLEAGSALVADATPCGPSPKGPAEHPVYALVRLRSVDGRAPALHEPATGPAYRGTVRRFNFARHGAANGVILDSGDFIHTRPEGMAKLRLKIGDTVEADGDAQRLVDDTGWAVEATTVNGHAVRPL